MPQIKTSLAFIGLCLGGALALSGCGDRNSQGVYNPDTGKHLANWLPAGHRTAAHADLQSCTGCHGENLDGGISKVSCTLCHLGSARAVHPLQWGQYAYARHRNYVELNGTSACANADCHGPTLAGVAGSGPQCATACHIGGALPAGEFSFHPTDWNDANDQPILSKHALFVRNGGTTGLAGVYDPSSCSNAACHGNDYRGVFLTGPSCYQCHPADPTDPAPLPDKHPHRYVSVWIADQTSAGFHGNYLKTALNLNISSCITNLCHGAGGTAPSCSTPSFNGTRCH